MKKTQYIFVIIGFLFSTNLVAQKKIKSPYNSKRQTPAAMLDEAQRLSEDSPSAAIKVIEKIISNKNDKSAYALLDEAYFILGKIYEDINQNDLAIERYKTALTYTSRKDGDQQALIYYRLGILALEQENKQNANINFDKCISLSTDDLQKYQCETGKIDVLILNNENDLALAELNRLQTLKSNDSLALVQIETRKSQVYSQMDDFMNAALSIQNAYNTMPQEIDIRTKTSEVI